MGEDKAEEKPQSELFQLALKYLKKEGYRIDDKNTTMEGRSGTFRKFDVIAQKGRTAQGVWARDWNRTIGVNVIITLDKASEDVGLSGPILVGEKFSDHARAYANRKKIMLLTKRQLMQSLR